ncbi:MAG: hypothetical protein ACYSTY_12565 [Planctomycetota bacterium]
MWRGLWGGGFFPRFARRRGSGCCRRFGLADPLQQFHQVRAGLAGEALEAARDDVRLHARHAGDQRQLEIQERPRRSVEPFGHFLRSRLVTAEHGQPQRRQRTRSCIGRLAERFGELVRPHDGRLVGAAQNRDPMRLRLQEIAGSRRGGRTNHPELHGAGDLADRVAQRLWCRVVRLGCSPYDLEARLVTVHPDERRRPGLARKRIDIGHEPQRCARRQVTHDKQLEHPPTRAAARFPSRASLGVRLRQKERRQLVKWISGLGHGKKKARRHPDFVGTSSGTKARSGEGSTPSPSGRGQG